MPAIFTLAWAGTGVRKSLADGEDQLELLLKKREYEFDSNLN